LRQASLNDLKKELRELSPAQLSDLCIALARYKKDNKEFLGYLLFDAHDKPAFVTEIKSLIDEQFKELNNQTNLYYAKKSLRKILRMITRYCKYMGEKALTAELLIYYCRKLKDSGIPIRKSQLIANIFEQQVKKINVLVASLHEDLQADYRMELEQLISA
jgi:hypothetical protein